MRIKNISFKQYPKSVRNSIILVISAWVFFVFSHTVYTGNISFFHLTMGTIVCLLTYSMRNWGRIVTIVYDFIMALFIGGEIFFLIKSGTSKSLILYFIKCGSIILFLISSVLLLTTEVKSFYKEYGK